MKKILTIIFLLAFVHTWAEEDAGYEMQEYEIKNDSIYLTDGSVYLLEEFYLEHPDLRNYIEGKEKIKKELEDKNKKDDEYKFDKTWKFYLLIFIFPVILLLFAILYLKSRKRG